MKAEYDLSKMKSRPNPYAAKLKKLAFSSHRVHFESGEMLFHQGDDADHALANRTRRPSRITPNSIPNSRATRIARITLASGEDPSR